ncbi:Mitochondrial ribosome and complex I assembly factor [Dirofilaria immitis]
MLMNNRLLILSLYKRILRKADSFIYTDKEYFCERVYREFFFNKKAIDKKAERLIEKAEQLLKSDRFC